MQKKKKTENGETMNRKRNSSGKSNKKEKLTRKRSIKANNVKG
jgi:hypothetical protein